MDNEETIARMGDLANWPRANRLVIDGYWGAAFHWIAYGCHQKHGKHKEKHSGLVSFLRELGDSEIATRWEKLENVRKSWKMSVMEDGTDTNICQKMWTRHGNYGKRFARGRRPEPSGRSGAPRSALAG